MVELDDGDFESGCRGHRLGEGHHALPGGDLVRRRVCRDGFGVERAVLRVDGDDPVAEAAQEGGESTPARATQ